MSDKSRQDFETWIKTIFFYPELVLRRRDNGEYISTYICARWEAWQASRAAIEIELPKIDSERYFWADGVFNLKEDIAKFIRVAGLKVKGE